MKNINLVEYLLFKPIERFGEEHIISIFNGVGYSYGYYSRLVEHLGNVFKKIGVSKEAVIVFMEDSPSCIASFLSLVNIGAKPLLVSPKTVTTVRKEILTISKARLILVDESTKNLLTENERSKMCLISNNECNFCNETCLKDTPYLIDEQVAYLALTSGSSGVPKIVMHSSSEMLSAINYYAVNTLKISSEDVLFSIPKISFSYGLANSLFFSFYTGAKAILYSGTLDNKKIAYYVKHHKATFFFAVPTLYNRIVKDAEFDFNDLETVCNYISAGEYLPSDLIDLWYEYTNKFIVDSVGCSETGSAYLVNFNSKEKAGSAGCPVEGYNLSFAMGDCSQGMLVVEGPSNAIGYLNSPHETSLKFHGKAVHTGDWFYKDEDGYYWFLGRKDDMIKRNGRWVSLNQITDCAKKSQHINNAVTMVVKSEILLVIEIDTKTEEFNMSEFEQVLMSSLEHYKRPDKIIIDVIPVNTNGKKDLKELRERYEC